MHGSHIKIKDCEVLQRYVMKCKSYIFSPGRSSIINLHCLKATSTSQVFSTVYLLQNGLLICNQNFYHQRLQWSNVILVTVQPAIAGLMMKVKQTAVIARGKSVQVEDLQDPPLSQVNSSEQRADAKEVIQCQLIKFN